jgi:hypothetical protein
MKHEGAAMKLAIGFVLALGCSSNDVGGSTTGVSCEVKDDRICCSGDQAERPTCVDGTWRCPSDRPNFVPSAQCMTPRPYDTGVDASEETISCPAGTALECPSGCVRHAIERYDETRGCLVATGLALCFPEPHEKCLGIASCRRDGAGQLFRVPSTCMLTGYEFCAGAEDTKVLSASACDGG